MKVSFRALQLDLRASCGILRICGHLFHSRGRITGCQDLNTTTKQENPVFSEFFLQPRRRRSSLAGPLHNLYGLNWTLREKYYLTGGAFVIRNDTVFNATRIWSVYVSRPPTRTKDGNLHNSES